MKPHRIAPFAALVLALWGSGTPAQPAGSINPSWEGEWTAVQASQGAPGGRLRISRETGATRLAMGELACEMAYDDTVTVQALLQRIQALREWQLDPQHWPPGTNTTQLVGLTQEFDRAQTLIQGIAAGSYRRVRLKGPGCEGPDDVFLLLHRGQELYRLAFSESSLGVAVASYRRQR